MPFLSTGTFINFMNLLSSVRCLFLHKKKNYSMASKDSVGARIQRLPEYSNKKRSVGRRVAYYSPLAHRLVSFLDCLFPWYHIILAIPIP